MDFVEACLKAKGREAVRAVRALLPSVKPEAIWAIIMHGAAWHEERSFDTSHATIAVYTVHRMIESLGFHPSLVTESPFASQTIHLPEEQRKDLQEVLLERLAYHLADTDHWRPEHGPRYDIQARLASKGNAVQVYVQSIRENSQMSALKAAAVLGVRHARGRSLQGESPRHGGRQEGGRAADAMPRHAHGPGLRRSGTGAIVERSEGSLPSRPPRAAPDPRRDALARGAGQSKSGPGQARPTGSAAGRRTSTRSSTA